MWTQCGTGEAGCFPSVVWASQGAVCVGTISFTECV